MEAIDGWKGVADRGDDYCVGLGGKRMWKNSESMALQGYLRQHVKHRNFHPKYRNTGLSVCQFPGKVNVFNSRPPVFNSVTLTNCRGRKLPECTSREFLAT